MTDKETQAAFSGPAVAANRFIISVGEWVRIGFLEQSEPGETPAFRTAVVLSRENAITLAKLIVGLQADAETQRKSEI